MSLISIRVLSFSLGVRMSLFVEGVGHMPRRCAATVTNPQLGLTWEIASKFAFSNKRVQNESNDKNFGHKHFCLSEKIYHCFI